MVYINWGSKVWEKIHLLSIDNWMSPVGGGSILSNSQTSISDKIIQLISPSSHFIHLEWRTLKIPVFPPI